MARWRVKDDELVMETSHGSGELCITLTNEGISVSVVVDVLTAEEIRVKLGAAIGVAQGELQ